MGQAVKIQESTVDNTLLFNINGLDYEKGGWGIFYLNLSEIIPSVYDSSKQLVGIRNKSDGKTLQDARNFSAYCDGTGTAYTSLQALLTDLIVLITL